MLIYLLRGVFSSDGRALDCGSKGREFKPHKTPSLLVFSKLTGGDGEIVFPRFL